MECQWNKPGIIFHGCCHRFFSKLEKAGTKPKADGKTRSIGVPTIVRAVLAAMTKILEEIYEQDFLKCSFGFRSGLSCHHALATFIEILYKFKSEHVLGVEIQETSPKVNSTMA